MRQLKTAGRNGEKKTNWLADGGGFVPHRLNLIMSPSWRSAPKTLRKILERIEIEHMCHGGAENGQLRVSYNQFVEFGISKRTIQPSLLLGVRLGLVKVGSLETDPSRNIRPDNIYSLTYVPLKGRKNPTDEWKSVTEAHAASLLRQFQQSEKTSIKLARRLAA